MNLLCDYVNDLHSFFCLDLITDDITDDVACVNIIYARHGFSAWYGWRDNCDGQDVESYVSDCGLDP